MAMDTNSSPKGEAVEPNQEDNKPQLLSQTPLAQKLRSCDKDRASLQKLVERIVKDEFTESIRVVEEILKYDPTKTDPEKSRLFNAYRSRLLNNGNRLMREIPALLGGFYVEELIRREVTTVVIEREPGPWGLPKGVKHPSQRST